MNDSTPEIRTRWDVIGLLAGTALVAVTLVPAWGVLVGYEPGLWMWFFPLVAWNGFSITAGYHRLWSHRSYQTHPAIRLLFALGGALSLQNSIKEWCSNHRNIIDTSTISIPIPIRPGAVCSIPTWAGCSRITLQPMKITATFRTSNATRL